MNNYKQELETKKYVNIGIDVGTTSVGYAVLDKNYKILIHGVRLFDSLEDNKGKLKSQNRREKRSLRRRLIRMRVRKLDLIKLFIKYGLFEYNENTNLTKNQNNELLSEKFQDFIKNIKEDVYECRKLSIEQKLNKNQMPLILKSLYWYLSNRGFSHKIADEIEEKDKTKEIKEIKNTDWDKEEQKLEWIKQQIKNNANELPINFQYDLLKKGFSFTPSDDRTIKDESITLHKIKGLINYEFHTTSYQKEIEQLFEKQKNLFGDFYEEFKNEYLKIFLRKRAFEEGPGSEKSPTKYGLYNLNDKNEIVKEFDNLWDKNIGKCSLFPDEKRTTKNSMSYFIFNVLSNSSLSTTIDSFLSPFLKTRERNDAIVKHKINILKSSINFEDKFSKIDKKLLKKIIIENFEDAKIENLNNLLENDNLPKLNKLDKIETILKKYLNFKQKNQNDFYFLKAAPLFDLIMKILSKTNVVDSRVILFNSEKENIKNCIKNIYTIKENKNFNEIFDPLFDEIAKLTNIKSNLGNLSEKALEVAIPKLLEQNTTFEEIKNEIEAKNVKSPNSLKQLKYNKHIPTDWIQEEYFSPTIKRALKQTIYVINALFDYCRKKGWIIENICLEMPRDKNSNEEKLKIDKINETNKKNKEIAINELKRVGYTGEIDNNLIQKLTYYFEQEKMDIYTGEKISDKDIKNGLKNYEIEHIIPMSISRDNSKSNKALSFRSENRTKTTIMPHDFLDEKTFKKMENIWKNEMKLSAKKIQNLTSIQFERSIHQRHLNDVRYIAKVMLNVIEPFIQYRLKENDPLFDTNSKKRIKTTTGHLTGYLRSKAVQNNWPIKNLLPEIAEEEKKPKNRDWQGHHAQDAALIVYASTKSHFFSNLFNLEREGKLLGKNIEIINPKELEEFIKNFEGMVNEINLKNHKINYSKRVEKPNNTSFYNETIYSSIKAKDNNKYKISTTKISDLKNKKEEDIKKILSSSFLSNSGDEILFNLLKDNLLKKDFLNEVKKDGFIILQYKNAKGKEQIRKITKIRHLTKKNPNLMMNIENKNVKNKQPFYERFNWIWVDLYRYKINNINNWKYIIIPANVKNVIFDSKMKSEEICDEQLNCCTPKIQHTNKVIYRKDYWDNVKSFIKSKDKNKIVVFEHFKRIFKNTLIKNEANEIFYINGAKGGVNQLEIKYLTKKILKNEDRKWLKFNSKEDEVKGWTFVDRDILGRTLSKKVID